MVLPRGGAQISASPIQEQQSPGVESQLAELAPARNRAVLAELGRLGPHPWAGVYRTAARWPKVLAIAPEAGYTLFEGSSCGNCSRWRGMGRVRSGDEESLTLDVELGFELAAEPSPATYALEETLHFVPWGDLVFAVPPWRMPLFCAEVSGGHRFPSDPFRYVGAAASFDYEEPPRPKERPRVPAAYRGLIPELPIECTVVALVGWRELDVPAARKMAEGVFLVDAGTEQGVEPGLYFHTVEDWHCSRWWGGDARVERVEAEASRVVIRFFDQARADAERLVGSRMSTVSPRAATDESAARSPTCAGRCCAG